MEAVKEFISKPNKTDKTLKGTTIKGYVVTWPNRIKQQLSIDIYAITDIDKIRTINAYFKKGGKYKTYNDKNRGYPSAVMSQYGKYIEFLKKGAQ